MTKKLTKDALIGKAKKMTIGDRISQLRGKESRKSLCEKLGVSIRTLINYENNARMPGADFVAKLCVIYNVTTDWLIFGKTIETLDVVDLTSEKCTIEHNVDHSSNIINPPLAPSAKKWASSLGPIDFKSLWDEYWNEQEARRGWLQVEVIKRFPEFIEWLEQRQAPLNPAQIAALKKREQLLHYGLPNQLEDD